MSASDPNSTSTVQRNLFSADKSPVPFSFEDITALLPSEESEFAFGILPTTRAALPRSRASIEHPELVNHPSRSLFGTLIQAYALWGRVARGACLDQKGVKHSAINLWHSASEYSQLSTMLNQWEAALPRGHRWSEWYLRIYKTETLDLVCIWKFWGLQSITHLCIVICVNIHGLASQ